LIGCGCLTLLAIAIVLFLFVGGGLAFLGLTSSSGTSSGSSSGSGTCADAVKCCKMLSQNVPAATAACDNLKNLPAVGDACQRALDGYQKALKAQGKTCP